MFQDAHSFFFLLNNIENSPKKIMLFRISIAAGDRISGKNTDIFRVCKYFLLIDPNMLSVT